MGVLNSKPVVTYHLGHVTTREDGTVWHSLVLTEMSGDRIVRRAVVEPRIERDLQEFLDHVNRTAMRVFYFGEGESYFG